METPLAAIPLRGMVIFSGMIHPILVGRDTSMRALEAHIEHNTPLVLIPQLDDAEEDPTRARLSQVGVLAQVLRVARLPEDHYRILVEGMKRVRITSPMRVVDGMNEVDGDLLIEAVDDPIELAAVARQAATMFQEFLLQNGMTAEDHAALATPPAEPARLADQLSGQLEISQDDRIALLNEASLLRRLERLVELLAVALAGQRLTAEVFAKVQGQMDKSQKEYTLKEQIKLLRKELKELTGDDEDGDQFEQRVEDLNLPEKVREEATREVRRLDRIHQDSAEYTITRTWLETFLEYPWNAVTTDHSDLPTATAVLDEDHYGLEKVKERVLEYLAVRQLNPGSNGPILCFVGPPGVGKTSLGRSIARALGRSYVRVALGGIKDETEIRGHRRTYIGALPGRIIRALTRAGTHNPVMVLDELDKLGNDFRGDPSSALLEVLDPEQNSAFVDHYLDVPVDLSQVLFVATANVPDQIPAALMDRLEVIELPGYTEEDKLEIARHFLLPRQEERHGLKTSSLRFTTPALQTIVREYTMEAGVRSFERQLATIHRKVARKVVEGKTSPTVIGPAQVSKFLGPQRFYQELAERGDLPGIAIGLAWTAAGGAILFVEAAKMEGKGGLKLTGSLGEVMKESAEAALTWLKSHASLYNLDATAFNVDIHLHVPAGAIPKDGPSAGVSMVTALASLLLGKAVRQRLAMTGEITLRGKVLPVGGVKEKVLAARRAGVDTVILPRHNHMDLDDIPRVLRRDLTFHLVDTVEDVLAFALAEG
ncbi:MAG: endopeptidase La [Deltaproteobacteria bacterium]|nr:endopeptidase La [Deltaproteobacteria bacterium]